MKALKITAKPVQAMRKTYVIVKNAGTDNAEYFHREYYGPTMAYDHARELSEEFPDDTFDVMKKCANGAYTTEF